MFDNFKSSLKSSETDDWFDTRVVRPLGYLWALLFARLDIHPNTVTIISMFIGAGSAIFYLHGSYYYEGTDGLICNIIAILLLFWAAILDCTDGQLARMTGKKSPMGRILDGLAGFAWFLPIYYALVYRICVNHEIEFGWLGLDTNDDTTFWIYVAVVFVLGHISGFAGMGGQSRLVDYYIQIHLFFLKGEKGSELDDSKKQQQMYDEVPWEGNRVWKTFQRSYIDYTIKQEKDTPQFQRLMAKLKERYGSAGNMPEEIRKRGYVESKALMPLILMVPFNFRMLFFCIFCLMDVPVLYFLFETIVMSLLCMYIKHRHESFCRRMADEITIDND